MKPDLHLNMEKPVYGGDCLAHADGKAVLVSFTLPGETVAATVVEEKRKLVDAEVQQILVSSPNRVNPRCPHFGTCGGCHYQHADYPTQLALKQQILRETLHRGKVKFPAEIAVLSANPWAYRNRIRLAVSPDGEIGYRSRRSNAIVPIRECPIATRILVEIAMDFASIIDPKDPRNQVAEIGFFTSQDSSEVLLTFHHHTTSQIFRKLCFTPRDGSSRPHLSFSDEQQLTYRVAGQNYLVPHGAFFQVNRWLLDDFVARVTGGLSGNTAWDLYAGVGLFARQLSLSFQEVIAVESSPFSQPALEKNLAGTCGKAIKADTLDYLRRNREQREPRPDCIVLDPPRAGLGEETTTLLNAIGAPQMVYASCDPATLARDLRALTAERYRIESVTLADMFPQTFHIETVVRLSRA